MSDSGLRSSRVLRALGLSSGRSADETPAPAPPPAPKPQGFGWGPWEELRRELHRSLRYGHHFVLIRVPSPDGSERSAGRRWPPPRQSLPALASLLRTVDRIWSDPDGTYVLLPECDRSMGQALLARIRQRSPRLLPDQGVGLASFPEDGLTAGELLGALDASATAGVPAPAARPSGDELAGVIQLHARRNGASADGSAQG